MDVEQFKIAPKRIQILLSRVESNEEFQNILKQIAEQTDVKSANSGFSIGITTGNPPVNTTIATVIISAKDN